MFESLLIGFGIVVIIIIVFAFTWQMTSERESDYMRYCSFT